MPEKSKSKKNVEKRTEPDEYKKADKELINTETCKCKSTPDPVFAERVSRNETTDVLHLSSDEVQVMMNELDVSKKSLAV